jgi:hypothetical protein
LHSPESSSGVQVLGRALSPAPRTPGRAPPCVVWGCPCVGMLSHIPDIRESSLSVAAARSLDCGTSSGGAATAASDGMTDRTDHTDMAFDPYGLTCGTPNVSEIWKRTDKGHTWNIFLLHATCCESVKVKMA